MAGRRRNQDREIHPGAEDLSGRLDPGHTGRAVRNQLDPIECLAIAAQRELPIGSVRRVVVIVARRFGVEYWLEMEGGFQLVESRNTAVVAKWVLLSAKQRRGGKKGGQSPKGHPAIQASCPFLVALRHASPSGRSVSQPQGNQIAGGTPDEYQPHDRLMVDHRLTMRLDRAAWLCCFRSRRLVVRARRRSYVKNRVRRRRRACSKRPTGRSVQLVGNPEVWPRNVSPLNCIVGNGSVGGASLAPSLLALRSQGQPSCSLRPFPVRGGPL
jgi:hypothetical protein